jgi:uncharacterized protein YjbJ (UPF0337 family)
MTSDVNPQSEPDGDEVTDSPATWENVVVGEVKETVGRILHNKELAEEGREQVEAAHEVREEYEEQKDRED